MPLSAPRIADYQVADVAETREVALIGDTAFLSSSTRLISLDVTDPANIIQRQSLTNANAAGYANAEVDATHVAVLGYSTGKLSVYDVSNPASMSFVASVTDTATLLNVNQMRSYLGRYLVAAAVGNNKVTVVDCVNPAAPVVIGSVAVTGPASLRIAGSIAWVGRQSPGGLTAVDLTTPSAPTVLGSGNSTDGCPSLTLDGVFAYTGLSATTRIQAWDISTPSAPSRISGLTDARFDRVLGMTVITSGRLLAVGSQSDVGLFSTVDIRDPLNMVYDAQLAQPTPGGPGNVGSGELYHSFACRMHRGHVLLGVAGSGGLTTINPVEITAAIATNPHFAGIA